MLQLLAFLVLLIEIPAWFLMIFLPQHPMTRQLVTRHLIFIPLGLLFIFLAVGLVVGGLNLGSNAAAAINSVTTDPTAIKANTVAPLVNALHDLQSSLPTLAWVILAASSIMDLAGGGVIYNETQRMGTSRLTAGVLLFFTYLTGPVGMLIFALWRYLSEVRQNLPVTVPTIAKDATVVS